MPWCPKCKNEYVEGVLVCADCGCPLVDRLEEEGYLLYQGAKADWMPGRGTGRRGEGPSRMEGLAVPTGRKGF